MNIIDRTISFFDPHAGLRRMQARTALEIAGRSFDAAKKGRRTNDWNATNVGPNTLLELQLDRLRARSRDLERNDVYARKGIKGIATNVVGTGIIPNPKLSSSASSKKLKQLWKDWAGTKDCDFYGQHNFYGLQRMAMMAIVRDGEVIIRRRRMLGGTLPFKIQVQEADCIDTTKNMDTLENGGFIIQGVEFDSNQQRVAYWLWDRHPSETGVKGLTSRRIPASEVAHVLFVERPGQVRGIPWMVAAMLRLNDFGDYEDAELVRQKIAACFTVFVHDMDSSNSGLGGKDEALGVERVEPGIIENLPAGKTVTFAQPPVTQNYDNYARRVLQGAAAGLGVSYEMLSGDLKGVNFSSGRMGWIEMQRNVEDYQFNMMIPQLCDSVWAWFTEAGYLVGRIPANAIGATEWTPPRREMIDPSQEINAQINAVRAGIYSLSEVHRQNGYDSEIVLDEMAADNERIDKLGLILDSDARKTMKAGVTQAFLKTPTSAAEFTDPPVEEKPTQPAQ